jgi:hypothetical protein
VAEGPIPDWITIGSYEEFGAGILSGELASQIAEDQRRRKGRQKPR